MSTKDFYRAFEEKHRGSRELIKERVSVYLPFVLPLKELYPDVTSLDIGCGRGEWLELLKEKNILSQGIDLDEGMLEACNTLGLNVQKGEGIAYLKAQTDASMSIITAFHVVEHISFEDLQCLIEEALRVLVPGGLLIMETPNPENIKVGTENFYLDPTHLKPIPSSLLSFLPEYYGYERTKVLRLQESKNLLDNHNLSLQEVLAGVSPDYAVIAQKEARKEIVSQLDEAFSKDFGLSLEALSDRFENRIRYLELKVEEAEQTALQAEVKASETEYRALQTEVKASQTEDKTVQVEHIVSNTEHKLLQIATKANNAEQKAIKAETKAAKAERKANEMEHKIQTTLHHYQIVTTSNSWKMTKPLRVVGKKVRWFTTGVKHWVTLSPTSRPRRITKKIFQSTNKTISKIVGYFIAQKINKPITKPKNQQQKLLIDCSFIYTSGLNTGIQRVVRNIVNNISPYAKQNNIDIVPVALVNGAIIKVDMENKEKSEITSNSKFLKIIYKIKQHIHLHISSYSEIETIYKDDILLMLDSTWHLDIWPSIKYAKNRGVKIIGVTYDLIPISHPEFCDDNLVTMFTDWYAKSLQYFDGYIAISETVMLDVQKYLESKGTDISKYSFDYFKLGSDFKELQISTSDIREDLQSLYGHHKSIYLIVSTIEPRKNHQYLFDTFKKLWESNIDVSLVIVGRVGWKTEKLLGEMTNHPEYKKRLWIFSDLDDQALNYCYKNSKALLFPSFIEGYGLPIIESLQNALPVLASDTPIHREVGQDNIDYFDITDKSSLAKKIENIENCTTSLKAIDTSKLKIFSWKESASELLEKVIGAY